MSEMIERVAAAIYKSQEWDFASDEYFVDLSDGCKKLFETAARAAIEAMREPTSDMLTAFYSKDYPDDPAEFSEQWELAVAAALADTNGDRT